MNRIDYIHPTAVEQIQKAMHGETVPSNDGNRDGMVNDVRYFSDYALSQIRGVDLGPEYNPAEASRYTVVFLTMNVDQSFDPSDTSTWKFKVENISSLADHTDGWVSCQLTTERVGILIGISQMINNPNVSQVICAVLKDLPESKMPSVGDVLPFSEVVSYRDYQTDDRVFNNVFVVQQALPGVDFQGTPWCGQRSYTDWGMDRPLMFFDIFVNYLFSQVMNSAGKTPTSVDVNMEIGPFKFQVKFPFFTIPTQA